MNPWRGRLLWAAATVLLAVATSLVVSYSVHGFRPPGSTSEDDFHRWMHDQLAITHAQHEALDPIEKAFEADRQRLRAEIATAGRALADAVRKGEAGSPEIEAALTRLNAAQAQLQRTTLDHFFTMKDHLDPQQAEKLLQWTHDSILPH